MKVHVKTAYLRNALRLLRTIVPKKSKVEAFACVFFSYEPGQQFRARGFDRFTSTQVAIDMPVIGRTPSGIDEMAVNLSELWPIIDCVNEASIILESTTVGGVRHIQIITDSSTHTVRADETPAPFVPVVELAQTSNLGTVPAPRVARSEESYSLSMLGDVFKSAAEFCGMPQRGWVLDCVYVEHRQADGVTAVRVIGSDGHTGFKFGPGEVKGGRRCCIPQSAIELVSKLVGEPEDLNQNALFITTGDTYKSDTRPELNGYDTRFQFDISDWKGMRVAVVGCSGQGTYPRYAFDGDKSVFIQGEQTSGVNATKFAKSLKPYLKPDQFVQVSPDRSDRLGLGAAIESGSGKARADGVFVPPGTKFIVRASLLERATKALSRFGGWAAMYTHPSPTRGVVFVAGEVQVVVMPCDPETVSPGICDKA